jgi:hypothetical protein
MISCIEKSVATGGGGGWGGLKERGRCSSPIRPLQKDSHGYQAYLFTCLSISIGILLNVIHVITRLFFDTFHYLLQLTIRPMAKQNSGFVILVSYYILYALVFATILTLDILWYHAVVWVFFGCYKRHIYGDLFYIRYVLNWSLWSPETLPEAY